VYLLTVSLLIRLRLVTDTRWKSILVSLLFVENDFGGGLSVGHLWSLSIEEQFYLFWPALFLLVGRRRLLAPTLGLILGIWVYRAAAIAIAPYDYGLGIFEHQSDFRMDSVLVGCALALALDRSPVRPTPPPTLSRWGTHPGLLIPLLFLWSIYFEVPPFLGVFLTVQTALMVGLVFHIILFPASLLGRLLRVRVLRLLGLISYSLYLWNQLFIAVSTPDWGFIRRVPFCLFMSLGIAIVSYRFVERPFLAMRRRLSIMR
jgi:peptidoglycan/LPS O-acetylase OafA/YrhL